MRAAAVIRAEVRRFWSDPVNGKFLLLLPAAVLLSLWPYAGTPLIPLFLFLFAGLEPQFNNILYRTPREFDALALLPVEWRAVVAAKNAAAILTFLALLIPFAAVLAYFSPLPLRGADIADGALYLLSTLFPLLMIGNMHSTEHPRRVVSIGPGDIAEAILMLLGVAAASLPYLLVVQTGASAILLIAWTLMNAGFWWAWSIPRVAARIVRERTQICLAE